MSALLRTGCAAAALVLAAGLLGPANAQENPENSPLREGFTAGDGDGGQPAVNDPYRELPPSEASPDRGRVQPNYGRRRAQPDQRQNYPGQRRQARHPLPRTEPYRTAPQSVRGAYAVPPAPPPPTPYAQPAQIPRPARPRVEENPYDPLGLEVGSLRLKPFVEMSAGHDSNPNRSPAGGRASPLARVDGGFTAQSNWSIHEFRADVRGGYSRYFGVNGADRPDGAARFNLRIDATRNTRFDFELRGALTTQRPGSPEAGGVIERPTIATFGASAGATHTIGRLEGTATLLYDRTQFEDGRLAGGGVARFSRDNYNAFGLRGRLAYELTPGIKPFAEATFDTRQRDNPVDAAGFSRNSTGVLARVGSTFELTRTLTGEIAAGYLSRDYADPRLANLNGPTVDAALIWSASPLTTVTFRAATTANETTIANASGSISRRGSVEINHALLRNFSLGAIGSWQNNSYRGIALSENIASGTLRADYNLTRSVVIRGSFTHERLKSSLPGADYTANIFLLGLRLQR